MQSVNAAPIGVYDSGVGGLSVLRELRRQLPHEDILFLADQANVPYGARPLAEVRRFADGVARFLIDRRVKLIVVACNTASAAALKVLRATFPTVPFVGMEPAVKPAAEQTKTKAVGVLATPATFQGELFASVVERFAAGVTVVPQTMPGLVERIEAGDLDGPETRGIIDAAVQPLVAQGVDTIVLACTHFPLVIPLIIEAAGPEVRVIDPAPAVARQAVRLLTELGLLAYSGHSGRLLLLTSGNPARLADSALRLIDERAPAFGLVWQGMSLRAEG